MPTRKTACRSAWKWSRWNAPASPSRSSAARTEAPGKPADRQTSSNDGPEASPRLDDISCGEILDGTATIQSMGERIFLQILAAASGQRTKSELLGLGAQEFAPWQIGITG
ncbi:hypothetical protein [Cupriavidus sp. CuC1]|uniref:hypothetical protein n=1 Tax=Cupriavidus sp. CuC1 TaxID=3373131 RepID=UPI0037D3A43E